MKKLSDATNDACSSAVRIELDLHPVSNENFDTVQTHLPCQVREHDALVSEDDPEERVGEGLFDGSLNKFRFGHMVVCADKNSKELALRQGFGVGST